MKIHEYQAKEILKTVHIPVPKGVVTADINSALASARKVGFPLVIKAQVRVGGRGKAGGIKVAGQEDDFLPRLKEILGMEIKGIKVASVLLEEAVDIARQFYLGITLDRGRQTHVIIFSPEGGVEIEETAKTAPEKIMKLYVPPSGRLEDKEILAFLASAGIAKPQAKALAVLLKSFLSLYLKWDCFLAEINPLVFTNSGAWMACDAKIIFDDNALFRHEELKVFKEESPDNSLEAEAQKKGLAYVKLDGDIGIIGNGAGLVMATMDEVKRKGGAPANFLDIGGGAQAQVMRNALEAVYRDTQVKGIFVNIFGGITRCDEVARGIIAIIKDAPRHIPVVLRLTGTQAEEGCSILKENGLLSVESMQEGAAKIVKLIRG